MTQSIRSYLFNNKPTDLNPFFEIYRTQRGTFQSLFKTASVTAKNTQHYWHQQTSRPRLTPYTAATNVGVFTVASSAGWIVGDRCRISGDRAVLQVTAMTDTTITTSFVAANGSTLTASTIPTTAGTLVFDSHPMEENSTSGPKIFQQAGREWNNTQIFRGDVEISRTAMFSATTDGSNDPVKQQQNCMEYLERQLNNALIYGVRSTNSASNNGTMGGLPYFDHGTGTITPIDASGHKLHIKHLNDAAASIVEQGGDPTVVLCSPDAARLFSAEFNDYVTQAREDDVRGSFVTRVISDVTGKPMTIFVEPGLTTYGKELWVMDPNGLNFVYFEGGQLAYGDTTERGTDGMRWSGIMECTAEFRDVGNTICRVTNFESPNSSLSETSYNKKVVVVQMPVPGGTVPNKIDTPTMTATKKDADEITLVWDNNAHAVTYQYRYATTEAGLANVTPVTAAYNASGVTIGSLTAATEYFAQVRAIGDGTNYATSDWSDVDSATTDAA